MSSWTSSAPSGSTCPRPSACGRETDSARAPGAAARTDARIAARSAARRTALEGDPNRLPRRLLDLEVLLRAEVEHARDHVGGDGLDRVHVRQHRVVVDLAGDGDRLLDLHQLRLELLEVLGRAELRVCLGECEEAAE